MEIGVPFTLDTVDFKIGFGFTTDCWYKHMWNFVDAHPIEIRAKRINTMIMALTVVIVADIATLDGRHITQRALIMKCGDRLRDHYDWPRSPPGSFFDDYAQLWHEALKNTLILQQGGPNNRTIYYCNWFGPWTDTKVLDRQECFFSPAEDRIYQHVDSEWRAWGSYSGRG